MTIIYKICPASLWQEAKVKGVFDGAPVDHRDGYIHFSTAQQVKETAAKHFAGIADLLVIGVDSVRLGENLKWERSRGDALFPHLYGVLALLDILWVKPLPLLEDGTHQFPPLD